jgi:hypothetical protein
MHGVTVGVVAGERVRAVTCSRARFGLVSTRSLRKRTYSAQVTAVLAMKKSGSDRSVRGSLLSAVSSPPAM